MSIVYVLIGIVIGSAWALVSWITREHEFKPKVEQRTWIETKNRTWSLEGSEGRLSFEYERWGG